MHVGRCSSPLSGTLATHLFLMHPNNRRRGRFGGPIRLVLCWPRSRVWQNIYRFDPEGGIHAGVGRFLLPYCLLFTTSVAACPTGMVGASRFHAAAIAAAPC